MAGMTRRNRARWRATGAWLVGAVMMTLPLRAAAQDDHRRQAGGRLPQSARPAPPPRDDVRGPAPSAPVRPGPAAPSAAFRGPRDWRASGWADRPQAQPPYQAGDRGAGDRGGGDRQYGRQGPWRQSAGDMPARPGYRQPQPGYGQPPRGDDRPPQDDDRPGRGLGRGYGGPPGEARWNHGWRQDRRYDWRDWRDADRDGFRAGRYYPPYRGYYYDRLSVGFYLQPLFFGSDYWIDDPGYYHLPRAYGPYRWVRYFDDVLLVDVYTGQVEDVIYDFFL